MIVIKDMITFNCDSHCSHSLAEAANTHCCVAVVKYGQIGKLLVISQCFSACTEVIQMSTNAIEDQLTMSQCNMNIQTLYL